MSAPSGRNLACSLSQTVASRCPFPCRALHYVSYVVRYQPSSLVKGHINENSVDGVGWVFYNSPYRGHELPRPVYCNFTSVCVFHPITQDVYFISFIVSTPNNWTQLVIVLPCYAAAEIYQQSNTLLLEMYQEFIYVTISIIVLLVQQMLKNVCVDTHSILKWGCGHARAPSCSPSMMSAPKNSMGRPCSIDPSLFMSRFLMVGILLSSSMVKNAMDTS